jgi:DNA-binding NarL/FixJ family response regulator
VADYLRNWGAALFKLLVVEDHALVREGLLQTLRGLAANAEPLGVGDAEGALALLEADPDFDLMMLDLMLPGMNGMAFLGVLRKRFPSIPVVVLSALDDMETVQRAMRHGASGYVPKSSSSENLLGALRQVLAGEVYLSEKYVEAFAKPGPTIDAQLTPSQMRVLDLLTAGHSNRHIAELLNITVGTVKLHLVTIFKTLGVNSRSQALLAVKKRRIKF